MTDDKNGDDMTTADDNYDDEYSEYDGMDDDEDEGGLSGFSVLMIGLVMFGAFAATTYVFYQKGIKQGERRAGIETPYVAADPEPIKIETADAGASIEDREVYDIYDGEEPAPVTVIDEAPEEPVDRNPEDAIGAITAGIADDVVEEADAIIANLEEEDAAAFDPIPEPEPVPVTEPTPANATATTPEPAPTPAPAASSRSAISGSHVVQVGSFRSNDEALAKWSSMQSKIGAVLGDKSFDIEAADLGARGVYHRLRVGPFASSDAANAYCATLKQNGQDCLPKRL